MIYVVEKAKAKDKGKEESKTDKTVMEGTVLKRKVEVKPSPNSKGFDGHRVGTASRQAHSVVVSGLQQTRNGTGVRAIRGGQETGWRVPGREDGGGAAIRSGGGPLR